MKTIAICNHKGGVGKTALSMAIAEGLHRKGKRTLLVDLDQQMNATQTPERSTGLSRNLKSVITLTMFPTTIWQMNQTTEIFKTERS